VRFELTGESNLARLSRAFNQQEPIQKLFHAKPIPKVTYLCWWISSISNNINSKLMKTFSL